MSGVLRACVKHMPVRHACFLVIGSMAGVCACMFKCHVWVEVAGMVAYLLSSMGLAVRQLAASSDRMVY